MAGIMFSPGCCCDTEPPPPVLGTVCFHIYAPCLRGASQPRISIMTIQDGSPDPINRLTYVRFGGTITGGTFTLKAGDSGGLPETTASISWSSDNETLRSNVQAAIDALSSVAPGDYLVTVGQMTAGIGDLYFEITVPLYGTSIGTKSLTGASTTLTGGTGRSEATHLNERQQILFDGQLTGGSFKLGFDGEVTASIAWHSNFTTFRNNIRSAMLALPNIGPDDLNLSFGLIFDFVDADLGGTMGGVDQPQITVEENLLTGDISLPADGAEVTLWKDGVEMSSGTTDVNGNIKLPIYHHFGPGFYLGVVHPDFYEIAPDPLNATIVPDDLAPDSNELAFTVALDYLFVPFRFDLDGPGVEVLLESTSDSPQPDFIFSGTSDAGGFIEGFIPGNKISGQVTAMPSNFDTTTIFPGDPLPVEGSFNLLSAGCGTTDMGGFELFPPEDWPL